MKHIIAILMLFGLSTTTPASTDPSAEDIIAFAAQAAGGDAWLYATTNIMSGHATLCRDGQPEACVHADRYVMWREYPLNLSDAHTGSGRFRLDAYSGDRILFQNSFDGQHSWTHLGRVEEGEAREAQASNFGFSAIRFAGRVGFPVKRLVDDQIEGHACHVVRVEDPSGGGTLFWIDRDSGAIRAVAWPTPRGFHQRIYSNFYWIDDPGFLQPGRVRLYYDGVLTADVHWVEASINQPIDKAIFTLGD